MAEAETMAGTRKPRALVTGGIDLLGSYLCARLLAKGYRVLCLDNLITGSLENVVHLEGEADFEYSRGPREDPLSWFAGRLAEPQEVPTRR